jgi:hypothetical protein
MTITILDIAQIRRMVSEPTQAIYTDTVISGYLVTASGDMNAVAGEIWAEKASSVAASGYDFSADNASYKLNQVMENYRNQAKYHNSRRLARTSLWVKDPVETGDVYPYDLDDDDFEYEEV